MLQFNTDFYARLFESLDNNALFLRIDEDHSCHPFWCTRLYAAMMEGTEEQCLRQERGGMEGIHPDDREAVRHMIRNHTAPDGSNGLSIRKYTLKGNEIWVNIHYTFLQEEGIQYAYCTYADVTELKQSQQQTMAMYRELNKELEALSSQSLAALRSNLTRGVVEEVHGTDLYDVDRVGAPISELMSVRLANMPVASDREAYLKVFDLERLQEKYYLGEGPSSLVIFSRRQSGRQCFIKYSASMRRDPVTGDVIVLGVETEYNSQKVAEVLNDKVLARQYDMVCYIVDETYGVVIGDAANITRGSIFPRARDGIYMEYIRGQVLPTVPKAERGLMLDALSLGTVAAKLEEGESYSVDVSCTIDGETFYKRFTYYAVDRETKFYILLKSDITGTVHEQREREHTQSIHNSMMEQLNAIADESLTVVRSNMSTGLIEDIQGTDLYPSDYVGNTIPAYAQSRLDNLLIEDDRETYIDIFQMDKLLERTARGLGPASLVTYCRRASGRRCFVKFSGSASRNPLTGSVDAFGMEQEYDSEMVGEVLNRKILVRQYDMVAYIIKGFYGVTIGDAAYVGKSSIFPRERDGLYMDYIRGQVIPAVVENERGIAMDALSLKTVAQNLEFEDSYTVDIACEIGDEIFYKRFTFYVEAPEQQFYILLQSDVTDVVREQRERERTFTIHNSMMEQFNAIADESLTVIRSNMSTGLIEDIRGNDLFPSDYVGNTIPDYARSRMDNLLIPGDAERYVRTFDMETLLRRTAAGLGPATLVCYSRRASGRRCFVKFTGSASRNPLTGSVDAFGMETDFSSELVDEVLNKKILAQQYDMVAYLVGGYYGVVIGDEEGAKGGVFPRQRDGRYMEYLREQVVPAISGTEQEREGLLRALSPETVAEKLAGGGEYSVDLTVGAGEENFHKRFSFYIADREKDFYVLLESDITELLRQERERNAVLADALREAQQANVAKTAFLSSMSHEIRTPMNAIIGLDSIALKDPELPERTRGHLEKIGGSARHLLRLINDILDMSRIESGRLTLDAREFSFREMLEQVNGIINGQCAEKGLQYDCEIIGTVDDCYIGDEMKLRQVIINILGNAVKFTSAPGKVTFSVERVAVFEGQSTLRFIMRDTGVGMEADFLPTIFDAFSQEDVNLANKHGSTGLGMAITKNLVDMMNGNISVESTKGAGTAFTVTVTLKNCGRAPEFSGGSLVRDMAVLIIDDDPIACEHAKLVLEEVGVSADVAHSGEEGLEMIRLRHARRDAYNLILVDMKMEGMDGVAVTRRIRELYSEEAAVVMLTAYSWEDIRNEAVEAGVDSFMLKPLFASSVLEELNHIVREKRASERARTKKAELEGRRILIVEDMIINAEIMREILEMRDIEVDHAENGKIAVDMFSQSPPGHYDAVLMDIRMPEMDGLAATEAIRALDRPDAKTVPIIAMTANAFDEDVQRSLQAGMNAHLSKPVEPARLYETLEELIQN